MKEATTTTEQIATLKKRGMQLDQGDKKAEEILLDIGYYRLGFYCFPFEKTYPCIRERDHQYKEGSKLSDVVKLYYLEVDLRNCLSKYIYRIEVHLRTNIIYLVSNEHKAFCTWFVEPSVVNEKYIQEFDEKVYNGLRKNNSIIKMHHKKCLDDNYAPAWKTLEFMTFGSVFKLLQSIKDQEVKDEIAQVYGIEHFSVFENYINAIVDIRNTCAHGRVLFDYSLSRALRSGPALKVNHSNKHILFSTIKIIHFILEKISKNRAQDMKSEIEGYFLKYRVNPTIKSVIVDRIGYMYDGERAK